MNFLKLLSPASENVHNKLRCNWNLYHLKDILWKFQFENIHLYEGYEGKKVGGGSRLCRFVPFFLLNAVSYSNCMC